MRALLDLLIPAARDGALPAAGGLGLAVAVADALEADGVARHETEAALEALRAAGRSGHGTFAELTPDRQQELAAEHLESERPVIGAIIGPLYLAYYEQPAVLAALGEPTHPRFPGGFSVEETDPRLLAALNRRRRG